MAILHQLFFIFSTSVADQPHGGEDSGLGLIRCQCSQTLLRGQLNIYTETVGQIAQLLHQGRVRTGNGFSVDISVEAIVLPQKTQSFDHTLSGVVRITQDAAGKEKPLNIIAPVELNR